MITLNIPKAVLLRAVEALRVDAMMEAGQSQAPDLIKKEDTQQWQDAKDLARALREHGEAVAREAEALRNHPETKP
jgi:hypothetical protein